VRVYLHPGAEASARPWPSVSVGQARGPEDAEFGDLDRDGATDVITSAEGGDGSLLVHWAPIGADSYGTPTAWRTDELAAGRGSQWLYAEVVQLDGRNGPDIVAGSKGKGGSLSWFEAPADPRDVQGWVRHQIAPAKFAMTVDAPDMDGDGDADVLLSDRGDRTGGTTWFENDGQGGTWTPHPVNRLRAGFAAQGDLDGDGLVDVATVELDGGRIALSRRRDRAGRLWSTRVITVSRLRGTGKGVAIADVDKDGRRDLVVTGVRTPKPGEPPKRSGVYWLSPAGDAFADGWNLHAVSADSGVKYDRPRLVDADRDGDLDILTTEEVARLGVVWYENPHVD
jgi:hypothetical protein